MVRVNCDLKEIIVLVFRLAFPATQRRISFVEKEREQCILVTK